MSQQNTLNVQLSNSELTKLKSGTKSGFGVTLKLSSNAIADSNDKNNFPHKQLLTNTQDSKLFKPFANIFSANIKLSKTLLNKIRQMRGYLSRLLWPVPKTGLSLTKHVLKPIAKNYFNTIRLYNSSISNRCSNSQKKYLGLPQENYQISNEEINDITRIVKSFKESGLLVTRMSETIENEAKEQKGGYLEMLLSTLGASILGNLLTGKSTIRAGEDTIRAGQEF